MGQQSIKVLVDGGKASAGPPLGPALGPLGVNVGDVITRINEKTKDFSGMKVPVEVIIDSSTKEFDVKTGSPPVSQLIMKEIGEKKLSSNAKFEKVGNLAIEQVIKIAKSKLDSMNCTDLKSAVKIVAGSCVSLGVLIENLEPNQMMAEIDAGKYDAVIASGKTEVSQDKLNALKTYLTEKKEILQKELEKLKAEEEAEEEEKAEEAEEEAEEEEKAEEAEGEKKEAEEKE